MNKVKILFFATLKDRTGTRESHLEISAGTTVSELKDLLLQRFPELPKSKASLLVAINKEYAFDQEEIPQGAEIALFPPVSGG
ncbi:MAG TPA: molybdopterin converting factor subunit 1 [Anaerolineales bacterium]|jgi:molybdopterin converting factor subunit 1|nr:molybdopterin converting factor subunit 1 [Anaerolineales bacterium]